MTTLVIVDNQVFDKTNLLSIWNIPITKKGNFAIYVGNLKRFKGLPIQILDIAHLQPPNDPLVPEISYLVELISNAGIKETFRAYKQDIWPILFTEKHITDLGFETLLGSQMQGGKSPEFLYFVSTYYPKKMLRKISENDFRLINEEVELTALTKENYKTKSSSLRYLHILQNLLKEEGYDIDFSKLFQN